MVWIRKIADLKSKVIYFSCLEVHNFGLTIDLPVLVNCVYEKAQADQKVLKYQKYQKASSAHWLTNNLNWILTLDLCE